MFYSAGPCLICLRTNADEKSQITMTQGELRQRDRYFDGRHLRRKLVNRRDGGRHDGDVQLENGGSLL